MKSRLASLVVSGYRAQVGLCLGVMLLAAVLMHALFLPRVDSVKVYAPTSNISEAVAQRFPIGVPTRYGETRIIKINLRYQDWQHSHFRLIPLGCIQQIVVNGASVPFDQDKKCNLVRGVLLDSTPYLRNGDNKVDVTILSWGVVGLDFGPELFVGIPPTIAAVLAAMFMMGFAGIFAARLRRVGLGKGICAIFFISVLFHAWQQHRMGYGQFANDWDGHVDYVRAISARLSWPAPYEGWVFYHPPLFYTLLAIVQRVASALGTFNVMVTVRFASFACYVGFLYYGVRTMALMIQDVRVRTWSAALFLFWPVSLLLGGRIDSHSLFYALYAASLYFLLLGLKTRSPRQVLLSLAIAGGALAIRSNTLVLFAIHGVVLLDLLWRERQEWPPLKAWLRMRGLRLVVVLIVVGASLNFGRSLYYRIYENRAEPLVVGNLYGNHPDTLITQTEPSDYLLLDVEGYFASPYWDILHDSGFWDAYLKSALYGAFSTRWSMFSVMLQTLLLGIWGLALYQLLWMRYRRHRLCVCYAAFLLIPVVAMMIHRYIHPFNASQDVRYVYPMIITLCGLFGMAMEDWRAKAGAPDVEGAAAWLALSTAKTLIAVFLAASVGMYIGQWYITEEWLKAEPEDIEISALPPRGLPDHWLTPRLPHG